MELAQNIRFLNLFLNLQFSLLEGTAPEATDQLLNENYRKIRQILASAPTTPAARRIRFQSKRIFPRLYHCYKLLPLASQPELLLNSLPGLMEQPWADEESKQLFLLMEAGCHMKMGHLDKGLELLKKPETPHHGWKAQHMLTPPSAPSPPSFQHSGNYGGKTGRK